MDLQTRDLLMQQLENLWGALAWMSYQLHGRGMLGVRIQKQRGNRYTLAIGYLSATECANDLSRQLVLAYDPAIEYVLLIGTSDEDAEYKTINLGRPLAKVAAEVRPSAYDKVLKPLTA